MTTIKYFMLWVVDLNVEHKMIETVHTVRMGQPNFRKHQLLKVYFSQMYAQILSIFPLYATRTTKTLIHCEICV